MKLASLAALTITLWLAVLTAAANLADQDAARRSETDRCLYAGGTLTECGGYR